MIQNGQGRTNQVETLLEKTSRALEAQAWFDAERYAEKALAASRARSDWATMIEAIGQLQAARTGRRGTALIKGPVRVLDEQLEEGEVLSPGRCLVQPPLVGADARRMRLACLENDVPALVLCREPTTSLGRIPLVAIAPGTTVRTQVDPPSNERKPTAGWFQTSLDALGDAAIQKIDPGQEVQRRIDAITGCLDAIPDHDGLHALLAAACKEALEGA